MATLGFDRVRDKTGGGDPLGLFGSGCDEFVYRKR